MIIGIGTDLINTARISESLDKFGTSFIRRILHEQEQDDFSHITDTKTQTRFLAKRFAMKEAMAKAVGTGIRQGVSWHDMIISHDGLGKPILSLSGATEKHVKDLLPSGTKYVIHVSVSDEQDYAQAFVIIESQP